MYLDIHSPRLGQRMRKESENMLQVSEGALDSFPKIAYQESDVGLETETLSFQTLNLKMSVERMSE